MQILKKLFKRKAFTLVELIVVIAIVAILAVTAGMMLTKWLGKAQDTRVITDMNQIEKSMDIAYIETAKYPMPDGATTISGDEQDVLWYQGKLGEMTTAKIDSLTKTPEDPYAKDKMYTYSVTTDQKKYQILSITTDDTTAYNPYLEQVYTNGYKSIVKGTYNDKFIIKGAGDNKKVYPAPSIIVDDTTKYATGPLSGQVYFITDKSENYIKEYEEKTGGSKGTSYISWTVGTGEDTAIASALTGAYENFQESGYEEIATMDKEEVIEEVEKTEGTVTVKSSCGSTEHGGTNDFYSTEEVAYGNSCDDVKATFTCDDGTWTHSSEDKTTYSHEMCSVAGASNCTANSSYIHNGHTYDIPEIPHSSTETTTSNQVNENNGTYTYTLSTTCDNGTYTSENETGPTLVSCDTGYSNDGSGNCVDSQAPTGGSVSINNGDASTTSTGVTLDITCASDNVDSTVEVAYGNNSSPTNWTSCTSSISHTLTSGDGTKTVYVRFKDSAGNISSEVSDSIEYSTIKQMGSNNGYNLYFVKINSSITIDDGYDWSSICTSFGLKGIGSDGYSSYNNGTCGNKIGTNNLDSDWVAFGDGCNFQNSINKNYNLISGPIAQGDKYFLPGCSCSGDGCSCASGAGRGGYGYFDSDGSTVSSRTNWSSTISLNNGDRLGCAK